jgi:hypothetical protein
MPKARKKKRPPKRVLALPDLEQAKAAVLSSLTSKSDQRTYDRAITDLVQCTVQNHVSRSIDFAGIGPSWEAEAVGPE